MAVTQFCAWPSTDKAAADTYYTEIQAWWDERYHEQFAAEWYPRQSTTEQWIVPYLGPPVETPDGPLEEPLEMIPLREDAELLEGPIDWLPED